MIGVYANSLLLQKWITVMKKKRERNRTILKDKRKIVGVQLETKRGFKKENSNYIWLIFFFFLFKTTHKYTQNNTWRSTVEIYGQSQNISLWVEKQVVWTISLLFLSIDSTNLLCNLLNKPFRIKSKSKPLNSVTVKMFNHHRRHTLTQSRKYTENTHRWRKSTTFFHTLRDRMSEQNTTQNKKHISAS